MTDDEPSREQPHTVRQLADVPVYSCHIYLSPPDERGTITARGATLIEVVAQGRSEREALRNVVQKFKEAIFGYTSRGETIPWLAKPCPAEPGETQRFVPVHF
jgi:hypothetical protein